MDSKPTLSSTKPYLFRAFYEWIADNECTPYLIVNTDISDVVVPTEHIHDGRIVLNVALRAISKLKITNEFISFEARFSGVFKSIFIPMEAVLAIYANENGQGMVFAEEDLGLQSPPSKEPNQASQQEASPAPSSTLPKITPQKGRPTLTLVK